MEYLSTSALARAHDVPPKELFEKLRALRWIDRNGDKWVLTDLGRSKGGQTRMTASFDEFIVWPEDLNIDENILVRRSVNATELGKTFSISSQRMNLILAELGWVEKNVAGWLLTKQGRSLGGRQMEHDSGATYVVWPPAIVTNKLLLEVVAPQETTTAAVNPRPSQPPPSSPQPSFRDKFEAKLRAIDGHYVRSRAEMLIDNWLYQYGIVHAYERRLPIVEECYCDFYIPSGAGRPQAVYLEFWGLEGDASYEERRRAKISLYLKHEYPLIELTSADVDNLDDVLPRKLLQYKIKVG